MTQRLVDGEALDQGGGGGNAQHRLGDEGSGEGAPILGRAAGAARRLRNEGFEADHIERRDETPERLCHRIDFLAQPREKGTLDINPAGLHGVEGIIGHDVGYESENTRPTLLPIPFM